MSTISVNNIVPRTTLQVAIEGVNPPTYQNEPLARVPRVVSKSGDIMTGPLGLHGNAAFPLQAVPKQQLDSALASLGSNKSHATEGYQVFPGGLIMQWFEVFISDPPEGLTGTSIYFDTYPIEFPTACMQCYATVQASSTSAFNVVVGIVTKSNTGVGFRVTEWSSAVNPVTISFLAIGF